MRPARVLTAVMLMLPSVALAAGGYGPGNASGETTRVVIVSDQTAVPVSGTVAVSAAPAVTGTVAVSGVAGTVGVTQSTSPWVMGGTVDVTQFGGAAVKLLSDQPRVSSTPYYYQIADGVVPGHSEEDFFGERATVAATAGGEDVWNGAAPVTPRPADAGALVSVVSSSAADTLAGANAQKVKILYITPAGNEAVVEVSLNGVTSVDTGILMRFIQKMYVSQLGTPYGAAAGLITAHLTGTAATQYEAIPAGANRSTSAHFFVPLGKTLYLTEWFASAAGTKTATVRLRATSLEGVNTPGISYSHFTVQMLDDVYVRELILPHKFPALTILSVRSMAGVGGASVSAGARGWIE